MQRVKQLGLFLTALTCILSRNAVAADGDDYEPVSEDKAADYLQDFGYASAQPAQIQDRGSGGLAADVGNLFEMAVRKFQEFANLPVTGVLDIRTKKKMAEPRCGLQDIQMLSSTKGPYFKWKKNDLTYRIFDYSTQAGISRSQQTEAIRKSFDAWSAVVPLNFREVSSGRADITVRFAKGDHGDAWPFDGRGGVLAHATLPTSGMLHFDDAENWAFMDTSKLNYRSVDLLPVAIHESGHILGLSHSKSENSIMAPFYQTTVDSFGNYIYPDLKPDDIRAIQEIYGPRRGFSSQGQGRANPANGSSDLWQTAKNAAKKWLTSFLDRHIRDR